MNQDTPGKSALSINPQASSFNSNAAMSLHDLPESSQTEVSLLPTQNGSLQLKGAWDGTRFSVMQDFKEKGAPVDLDFATQQIPKTTMGWLVSAKPGQTENIVNMGWRFGVNQQLLFSTAQLHGMVDLGADSKQNPNLNQLSSGLNYRYFFDTKWVTDIELTGYASGSSSQSVKVSSVPGDGLQYIAGSNLYGMRLGVESSPLPDAKLNIGLGSERLSYDSLGGSEPTQRLNTSIKWSQIVLPTVKYNASVEANGVERNLSTGLDFNLRDGQQLGVNLARTQWNDGQTSDNAIKFAYTVQFGKKFTPYQTHLSKAPWSSSLIPEVLERPSYLPGSVLSKPESNLN